MTAPRDVATADRRETEDYPGLVMSVSDKK